MNGFHVSFRARHPARDLSDFLAPLGIASTHSWKAGDKRRTPMGAHLEGVYDTSYYCCELPLPEGSDLAEWLKQAIGFLRPIAKELTSFVEDGGSLSFYIGLEKGMFQGTTIDPKVLSELGALRIFLEIDRDL